MNLSPRQRQEICDFLTARYAEAIQSAHAGKQVFATLTKSHNFPAERAEWRARHLVYTAEMRQALFEKTVRPYLGTAGPTGRIAEQQLLFLAAEHAYHPAYRPEWAPPGFKPPEEVQR